MKATARHEPPLTIAHQGTAGYCHEKPAVRSDSNATTAPKASNVNSRKPLPRGTSGSKGYRKLAP